MPHGIKKIDNFFPLKIISDIIKNKSEVIKKYLRYNSKKNAERFFIP